MKRRSFLQSVIGVLSALLVGTAKSDEFKVRFHGKPDETEDVEVYGFEENDKAIKYDVHTCNFRGYRIAAAYNRIEWIACGCKIHREGIPNTGITVGGYIDLPTIDVCQGLYNRYSLWSNEFDFVLWWGKREVWRINYVGGEKIFKFVLLKKASRNGKLIKEEFGIKDEAP